MTTIEESTEEKLDRSTTLRQAAALIEEHGWVQDKCGDFGIGFCLGGAVLAAAGCWSVSVKAGLGPGSERAHEILGGGVVNKDGGWQWRQAAWNDDQDRTREEVLGVLYRMADGASWEEATGTDPSYG